METLIVIALTVKDIVLDIITLGWWSRSEGDKVAGYDRR